MVRAELGGPDGRFQLEQQMGAGLEGRAAGLLSLRSLEGFLHCECILKASFWSVLFPVGNICIINHYF